MRTLGIALVLVGVLASGCKKETASEKQQRELIEEQRDVVGFAFRMCRLWEERLSEGEAYIKIIRIASVAHPEEFKSEEFSIVNQEAKLMARRLYILPDATSNSTFKDRLNQIRKDAPKLKERIKKLGLTSKSEVAVSIATELEALTFRAYDCQRRVDDLEKTPYLRALKLE